jgi:hypothetical protein
MPIIILHIIIKSSGRMCQKSLHYMASHVDVADSKRELELVGKEGKRREE